MSTINDPSPMDCLRSAKYLIYINSELNKRFVSFLISWDILLIIVIVIVKHIKVPVVP